MRSILLTFAGTFLFLLSTAFSQNIYSSPNRVQTNLNIQFKRLGTIKPKNVNEIESSNWTIGCEVLDRDYANYDSYKEYLPLLGIKKIRLQGGWAKTEKQKGVYNWDWLDHIINDAVSRGLKPYLQTSYGNPVYEGGGGADLSGGLPTSSEALSAWDRWVEALALRYKNKVSEWEMWNEPDNHKENTPEKVANLNIRTARIIKHIQPEAEIAGLVMASGNNSGYLDGYLKTLSEKGTLSLFKWIVYHGYTMNPDEAYKGVAKLDSVLKKYSSTLMLRQGENGAPSAYCPGFALSKYNWTEMSQAKWDMRRMLGDLGHDIESEVFTITDLYYKNWGDGAGTLNVKGLLQSDQTLRTIRPKVAYYAVQNIASVFDHQLERIKNFRYSTDLAETLSVFGYQNITNKLQVVSFWLNGKVPNNHFDTQQVEIIIEKGNFKKPVWVDLYSGGIYEIPKTNWSKSGTTYKFNVPIYDSPVLIADWSLLKK